MVGDYRTPFERVLVQDNITPAEASVGTGLSRSFIGNLITGCRTPSRQSGQRVINWLRKRTRKRWTFDRLWPYEEGDHG